MNDLNVSTHMVQLTDMRSSVFQKQIISYYYDAKREMPWRNTKDPFSILVSEFMLQQTQVERVLIKYGPFLKQFPDFYTTARTSLQDILSAWQGLGYNRRAMNLRDTAQRVVAEYNGQMPDSYDELVRLPGIGRATAGAVLAFAFNKPVVFIETNIRRVFIHFFFQGREDIHDNEIIPLIEAMLDHDNPRRWYYALMDYGSMLKKRTTNPNRRSSHYSIQPPFEGSNRQLRGAIIKYLIGEGEVHQDELISRMGNDPIKTGKILAELEKEGFLTRCDSLFRIR